jgi:hypothetical protein
VSSRVQSDWEHALAECEERLAAAEAGSPPAFTHPVVTGPLPAELEPRARAIVEQGESLERRLASEQERIRLELRRLPRMPTPRNQSRFDSRV